jgi:hypothetical protein
MAYCPYDGRMYKVKDLVDCPIRVGSVARAGSRGAWRAEQVKKGVREIWHYAHKMAVVTMSDTGEKKFYLASRGWNSSSDKRGIGGMMWKAQHELGWSVINLAD